MLTPAKSAELTALAEKRWGPKRHWVCIYCGSGAGLTVDHLWPRQAGGTDDVANLFPACDRCQSSKSDRPPIAWMVAAGVPEHQIARILRINGAGPGWTVPQGPGDLVPKMPAVTPVTLDLAGARRVPRQSAEPEGPRAEPDASGLPGVFQLDPHAWTPRADLFAAAESADPGLSARALYRDLERRGFRAHKRNGVRGFFGLRVPGEDG
ncbi:HNH endonuclease [Microbacterium oxydans]|uniref:HNH endonuclease n=1 Tax=Microbacterium oxydans TaxID=82380 RepID=UPI00226B3AE7|nr:HNH endonuclease [Microbacterium oxydans]WAA67794.1 HNH endonuclease [Microbacterium oxydans]